MTISLNRTLNTQQGFAHIAVMVLLLAGIVAGVYLVGQQTNIFPKAYSSKKPLSAPCTAAYCPKPTPTPSSKRVFITSTTYNGNLGGLSGADSKCQERANSVSLGGAWKAWLSDNSISASSRLTHSTLPYKLLDGTKIAENWSDLTDGKLMSTITTTETKSYHGNSVWTGTNEKGEIFWPGTSKCKDWTALDNSSPSGSAGHSGYTDYRWTAYSSQDNCANKYPLYCFEQ